jgi:hypothetical protein
MKSSTWTAMTEGQRSANSPQEAQPRPMIADDVQRSRERVSAGQTVFSGINQR